MPEKKTVKKAAPKTKVTKTTKAKKAVKAAFKPKVTKIVKATKAKSAASKTKTAPKTEVASKAKVAKEKKPKFYSTGEKCPASGLYEHFCKDKGENSRIPLSKTEKFPPCRTCGSVKWVLVMAA